MTTSRSGSAFAVSGIGTGNGTRTGRGSAPLPAGCAAGGTVWACAGAGFGGPVVAGESDFASADGGPLAAPAGGLADGGTAGLGGTPGGGAGFASSAEWGG